MERSSRTGFSPDEDPCHQLSQHLPSREHGQRLPLLEQAPQYRRSMVPATRNDVLHTWIYRLLGIVVLVLWLGTILTWIR